jgi:hypothetical protein
VVHRAIARYLSEAVARSKTEQHGSNHSIAASLIVLDPTTGRYRVADAASFTEKYIMTHQNEEAMFAERLERKRYAREAAAIQKEQLVVQQQRAIDKLTAERDPRVQPTIEGAVPEEIKAADVLEFERHLLELKAEQTLAMRLLGANAASALSALPRIGAFESIEDKAGHLYAALCSEGEALLTGLVSPPLMIELTRYVREELQTISDRNDRVFAEQPFPEPFYIMWEYVLKFWPEDDMFMFAKLAVMPTLRPDADGNVLPTAYLRHIDSWWNNLSQIKDLSKEAWLMYMMLQGLGKTDGFYILYERFFRKSYREVTAADVDDLRAAIQNSTRRIVVTTRSPKLTPLTEQKVLKAEVKIGQPGKSTPSKIEGEPPGKCYNCGEFGHWKSDCTKPLKPPGKLPYRVDKDGGYGKKAEKKGGGKETRRFHNTILDSSDTQANVARANVARAVLLDSEPLDSSPPLLDDPIDDLWLELKIKRSQICVVRGEMPECERGYTRYVGSPLEVYAQEFVYRAGRGLIDSGASVNLAPIALLFDLKPIRGKVRYGDGEIENIYFEGWLKLDILYGDLAASTRSGRHPHFKEVPKSYSIEVACWASERTDGTLFSTRAMAQGGAKTTFEDIDGRMNDTIDFTGIGGPLIALAKDASFAVHYERPPTFMDYMSKKMQAARAAMAQRAVVTDQPETITARRAANSLTPASSSGQEN